METQSGSLKPFLSHEGEINPHRPASSSHGGKMLSLRSGAIGGAINVCGVMIDPHMSAPGDR